MHFVYDDGGRAAAGYTGRAGDCVVRAIAIAVYDAINAFALAERVRRGRRSSLAAVWGERRTRATCARSAGNGSRPCRLVVAVVA
jgi:hypothetical protein